MLLQIDRQTSRQPDMLETDILRLRALRVTTYLTDAGLYTLPSSSQKESADTHRWKIGAEPLFLSPQKYSAIEEFGPILHLFLQACNTLYLQSVSGRQPSWVAEYLDIGKPEEVVKFARMRRLRGDIPSIIRPDVILTDTGYVITELDSVPGGFGLTSALINAYHDTPPSQATTLPENPLINGFVKMIRSIACAPNMTEQETLLAIVVSEEAKDYRPEMTWLATQLSKGGLKTYTVTPQEIEFTEDSLNILVDGKLHPVTVLYRFFELFDLKNIPKTELFMYSNKKNRVLVTPPFKAFLEEKMWFAFLHHPMLLQYWNEALGKEHVSHLQSVIPKTWILDPRPLPPHALIPEFTPMGHPINHWQQLKKLTKKFRHYVIKPSGFSPLAWGSRGVHVGHDLSQKRWEAAIDDALQSFYNTPYILQEFHTGQHVTLPYYNAEDETVKDMTGRVRLCPYYFINEDTTQLAGTMATLCSLEKKIIHGMKDAIIVPCIAGGNL